MKGGTTLHITCTISSHLLLYKLSDRCNITLFQYYLTSDGIHFYLMQLEMAEPSHFPDILRNECAFVIDQNAN